MIDDIEVVLSKKYTEEERRNLTFTFIESKEVYTDSMLSDYTRWARDAITDGKLNISEKHAGWGTKAEQDELSAFLIRYQKLE